MGGCAVTFHSLKRLPINLPGRLVSRSRRTANPLDGPVQRFGFDVDSLPREMIPKN